MTAPSSAIFKKTVEIINEITKVLEEMLKDFLSKIKSLEEPLANYEGLKIFHTKFCNTFRKCQYQLLNTE